MKDALTHLDTPGLVELSIRYLNFFHLFSGGQTAFGLHSIDLFFQRCSNLVKVPILYTTVIVSFFVCFVVFFLSQSVCSKL